LFSEASWGNVLIDSGAKVSKNIKENFKALTTADSDEESSDESNYISANQNHKVEIKISKPEPEKPDHRLDFFIKEIPKSDQKSITKANQDILELYEKNANKKETEDDFLKLLSSSSANSNDQNEGNVETEEENKIADLIFQDLIITESTDSNTENSEKTNTETKIKDLRGSVASLNSPSTQVLSANGQLDSNKAESNLSIASTLTNSSQKAGLNNESLKKTSLNSNSQVKLNEAETSTFPEWVKQGAHVIVSTNSVQNKTGHIRYIGATKFGTGVWIGVELEQKYGKNDGSVKGDRYFTCPDEHGVFVRVDKLSSVCGEN
jgi:hypothetical protein